MNKRFPLTANAIESRFSYAEVISKVGRSLPLLVTLPLYELSTLRSR